MKRKQKKTVNKTLSNQIKQQLERNLEKEAADTRVKNQITEAFRHSAELDADGIAVTVHNGTVGLWGSVNTWAEIREATRISGAVPGVAEVDAHLYIAR